jgi:hypothetical protein
MKTDPAPGFVTNMDQEDMIMKKFVALFLSLALFCAVLPAIAETLAGGWEMIPQEEGKIPEEAKAALEKAQETLLGASYKPLALLGTQLVAGTNYCILCEISPVVPNPVPHFALVYVYADLEGNATITNIADLDIAGLSQPSVQE